MGKSCEIAKMETLTPSRLASSDGFTNVHESLSQAPETILKGQQQAQQKGEQEQGKQGQAQQPAQVYTTVGSLYNPQASQPLQAPARRGRNIKWPPTPHSESPRPGLAKSALSSLPYINTNHHLPQSPPANFHNFPHYSPLRQNIDRAISPQARDMPSILSSKSPAASSVVSFGKRDGTNNHGDDHQDGEEKDEGLGEEEPLKHMSIMALRNLASYTNPMQKRAQKMLDAHRRLPLVSSHTQPKLSPSYHEPSDILGEQRNRPLSGRPTHSDPVAMAGILQSEQANGSRSLRFPPGLGYPSQGTATPTGHKTTGESTPVSILSRGPGAPQPLTAGPPGQRHYRSSALESAMHSIHGGLRRHNDSDGQSQGQGLIPNPYNSQMLRGRAPTFTDRDSRLSFEHEPALSIQGTLDLENGNEDGESKLVVDSMRAEDVKAWYPNELPANFGRATVPVPADWTREYPLDATHERRRAENLATHLARTREHFYSGTGMFDKSIAEAIEEKDRRIMHHTIGVTGSELGVIGGERKKAKSNAKLSIAEASRIPRHEHIEPLLSMALQNFAKLNETRLNAPVQETGDQHRHSISSQPPIANPQFRV